MCQSLHAFVRRMKKVVTERTALSIILWSRESSAEAFADNRNLSVLPIYLYTDGLNIRGPGDSVQDHMQVQEIPTSGSGGHLR